MNGINSKVFLFRFFAILLGLGAGLILACAAWLVHDWKTNSYDHPVKPPNQAAQFIYHPGLFYYPFRTRPAALRFTTEAFTEDSRFDAKHNSNGFRTPEYTIAHPPDTFRILIIGDSLSWGQGVSMEETFPYVTARLLRRKCARFEFEVISLGICGHRLVDNFIKLLVHGQSLKPDLVIFQVHCNDLDFYDYKSILRFQGHRSLKPYEDKEYDILNGKTFDWKVFVECLPKIKEWSNTNSIPVGFLVFPMLNVSKWGHNFDHYNPEKFGPFPQLSYLGNVVQEIRKNGFSVLYLIDAFRRIAGDRYLAVSRTDGHPNSYAHSISADALVDFLFQQGWIKCDQFKTRPGDPEWVEEKVLRDQAASKWRQYNSSYFLQLSFFNRVRELHPKDSWIAMQSAWVYLNLKRYEEAYHIYESIPDLSPGLTAPWFYLSKCTQNREKKVELLERMLQVVPDSNESMQALSVLYMMENRKEPACKFLQRLTQIPAYVEQYESSKRLYEENNCDEILGDL